MTLFHIFSYISIVYFSLCPFLVISTETNVPDTNFCQKYVDQSTCISSNRLSKFNINVSNPCTFSCSGIWTKNLLKSRRLFVKQTVLNTSVHVFTIVQSNNFIKTYTLPISFEDEGNQFFTSLSEVVCPSTGKIFFSITTNSEENVTIDFDLRLIDFFLPDAGVIVMSSPVSPWSKFYQWEDEVDSVFLSVESKTPDDSKICAILHIQQAKCPLATNRQEIQGSAGKYQSFREIGGTTVKRSEFPEGIFITILPLPNDDLCFIQSQGDNATKRRKTVVIKAIKEPSPKSSWIPYVTSFGIFSALIGSWLYTLRKWTFKHFTTLLKDDGPLSLGDSDLREPVAFLRILQVLRLFTNRNTENVPETLERRNPDSSLERSNSDDSLLISSRLEIPLDVVDMQQFPSTPASIPVTEELNPRFAGWWRSEAVYEEMMPSSKLSEVAYSRNLFIVAAFITIPVYSTLRFLVEQSDHKLDTCYFNRRCMMHVGYIQDFTKVFTNFGYIVVAVALKNFSSYHERLTLATSKILRKTDQGVCRQYSLFNVLAYMLFLQAMLSSVFHLCPNYVTIKFDIIYMYAIAVTYIGCLWSLRHSDFNQFTYSTFGLIASVLFLAESRNFLPDWLFWLIVVVVHVYLILSISYLLCKFGTFSLNPANMTHLYKKWSSVIGEVKSLNLPENSSVIPTVIRVIIASMANLVILVIGIIFDYDFYSYVFSVCMVNVNCYTLYYMFTKRFVYHERGTRHGWISILLTVICAIPAIVFFNLSMTDYNETPAESLTHNSSCLVSVFSTHDMWHFMSALTVFALFTGMLVLDDDLAVQESTEVPVF